MALGPQYLLYLIPLVFAVLLLAHIFLAVAGIIKGFQFNALNNKWNKLMPERQALRSLTREYETSSASAAVIRQLNMRRLNWSEKLNALSLNLPAGIWFNELSLARKDFILRGSVISLQKEEMSLLNKFVDNLKKDPGFFKDFQNLELNSAQARTIGGYDIFDFILTGRLKSR